MAPGELHSEPPETNRTEDSGLRTEEGPRRRRLLLVGAALAVLAAGAAAWFLWLRPEDLSGSGIYHGTGLVLAVLSAPSPLDAKRPVIILRHEPIPGLMEQGMTHPFVVQSEKLLRGVQSGSPVRFTLKDTPGMLLVVRLEVIQE